MKGWDILVAGVGTELNALGWESIGPYITGANYHWHPQDELLWRLNNRQQGKDPGQPVNWKGPR